MNKLINNKLIESVINNDISHIIEMIGILLIILLIAYLILKNKKEEIPNKLLLILLITFSFQSLIGLSDSNSKNKNEIFLKNRIEEIIDKLTYENKSVNQDKNDVFPSQINSFNIEQNN